MSKVFRNLCADGCKHNHTKIEFVRALTMRVAYCEHDRCDCKKGIPDQSTYGQGRAVRG
jgi:hypothetical protein